MPSTRMICCARAVAAALALFLSHAAVGADDVPAQRLQRLAASEEAGETVIVIHTDGRVSNWKHTTVSDPARIVVDLPGLRSAILGDRISVGTPHVERVRVGVYPEKLRLVIDAVEATADINSARIVRDPAGLRITIGGKGRNVVRAGPVPAKGTSEAELRAATKELVAAARELRAAALELRTRERAPAAEQTTRAPSVAPTPTPVAPRQEPPAVREAVRRTPPARETPAPPPTPAGDGEFHEAMAWVGANRNARPALAPGETLGQSDLGRLEGVLPPRYLAEFQFPEVEVEIQETGRYTPHPAYEAATLQWSGQVELREDRSLANFVAGRPFPEQRIIDASREDAAYMVAWNRVYRWQHYGYRTRPSHQAYLSPGSRQGRDGVLEDVLIGGGKVERHLVSMYHRVYLSHLATHADDGFALKLADAKRLRYKDYLTYTDPFELRGSSFVIERPIDPSERDQVNSYLPSERRVRRLSPKERADSFLGSEFTLDDFEGFSGRVLDYEWTFHGEKTILAIVDARGSHLVFHGPESRIPKDRWQLRDCYVIEQRPTLQGHPYGRKLLFFDKETMGIPIGLFFDPDDRLLKIVKTSYKRPEGEGQPDPAPADTVGHWMGGFAINVQTGVSTAVWSGETDIPDVTASQVRRLFSVANLTEGR